LLPSSLRASAVLVAFVGAGLWALGRVGQYDSGPRAAILAVVIAVALVLVLLPARRPGQLTTATVLAVNNPPTGAIVAECRMTLVVTMAGRRQVQVKRVERELPAKWWPRPGDTLPVEASGGRRPRATVRWDLVDFGADDGAGPGLRVPTGHDSFAPGRRGPMPPPDAIVDYDPGGFDPSDFEPHDFEPPDFEPRASGPRDVGPIAEFDEAQFHEFLDPLAVSRVDLIAAPEPSYLVRRYLFPTERFRGEWRRHWIRPLKEITLITAFAVLLQSDIDFTGTPVDVAVPQIPQAELVSQVVWALLVAWRGAAWYQCRFVLTHKRIMLVKGVLRRRASSLPLSLAGSTHFKMSLLGRILSYGAIRFSGVPLLRPLWSVGDLPYATDLYLQIIEETFEPEASEARRRPARVDGRI
jgi:hypothetical protein